MKSIRRKVIFVKRNHVQASCTYLQHNTVRINIIVVPTQVEKNAC